MTRARQRLLIRRTRNGRERRDVTTIEEWKERESERERGETSNRLKRAEAAAV